MKVLSLTLAIACIGAVNSMATGTEDASGTAASPARNEAPRLEALTARIGRVYDEAETRFRSGGLSIRFRLCDDGPQSTRRRTGLIRLDHRWGDSSRTWFAARELTELITWDAHFATRECVGAVPWSSMLPADLSYLRRYPCYDVRVQVRDPAGRWSNTLRARVKKCR
jgi:hypothetical protein